MTAGTRRSETRIKLLRGNIAAYKARMASAADKDTLRRRIRACEALLREELAKPE